MKHSTLALLALAVIPLCGCASDQPTSTTTTTTEEQTIQPAPVSTTTTTQQSTVQPMAPQ